MYHLVFVISTDKWTHSAAIVLRAVIAVIAILASTALVTARIGDTVARERYGEVKPLICGRRILK